MPPLPTDRGGAPPLSLYVHLPWCVRKCPYCDFNSHTARGPLPFDGYVDALLADLAEQAEAAHGREIETIFFGGGTPSLFPPETLARFLDQARSVVTIADGAEITLEANPGTVEHAPFRAFASAGINRVSIGVQSFDDAALARIGRIHGGREARGAIDDALAAGVGSVNVDLMYALPEQTAEAAVRDVETALSHGVPHVSHYQLTLEPNTLFHAHPPPLPDHDDAWRMQERCQALLADRGLAHYEVSAYARPGHRCRHNLNYWAYGDYLGIGAGAHGKLTDAISGTVRRTLRPRHPQRYLDRPAGEGAMQRDAPVVPGDILFEFALNAWRLCDGVPVDLVTARTGLRPEPDAEPWRSAIERGLLEFEGGNVRPTRHGATFLNDLTALFMPDSDA